MMQQWREFHCSKCSKVIALTCMPLTRNKRERGSGVAGWQDNRGATPHGDSKKEFMRIVCLKWHVCMYVCMYVCLYVCVREFALSLKQPRKGQSINRLRRENKNATDTEQGDEKMMSVSFTSIAYTTTPQKYSTTNALAYDRESIKDHATIDARHSMFCSLDERHSSRGGAEQ